jgi:D-glycero-D-manno-heptose 1,7-bisphosphate phosphatase
MAFQCHNPNIGSLNPLAVKKSLGIPVAEPCNCVKNARLPRFRSTAAVFLDRDGVINQNRSDHVKSWSEFRFLPGSVQAIRRLSAAGYRVFVITNQAIVSRGVVSHHVIDEVNARMLSELDQHGARVESVAYCPHRPDQDCPCRKPRPGLLLKLALRYGLDLKDSVVIGDALTDMQAGLAVGCRTILVRTGRGSEQLARAATQEMQSFLIAEDLGAATSLLLEEDAAVI